MKELFTMWKNTRMIVLVAITAAVYAAVLIPFKVAIPLIPGFTEVRPANVLPIICSLMFGPAAAWGSAIGNTIADTFGTFGLGTIFGFVGNFLYGFIPYKMWRALSKGEFVSKPRASVRKSLIIGLIVSLVFVAILVVVDYYTSFMSKPVIYSMLAFIIVFVVVSFVLRFLSVKFFLIIFTASTACGVFIGWGVHILGLVPFPALGNIILLNNLIVSAVLTPLLLPALYPVVKRIGLIYTDVMDEADLSKPSVLGSILMIIAVVGALVAGNWIAIVGYDMSALGAGYGQAVVGRFGLGFGVLPFILLMFIAVAVM